MPKPRIELAPTLAEAIRQEASAAIPRECCGLLEGKRRGEHFQVTALHPARNLSPEADRFEMDARDQFAAQKAARAKGLSIIGCYHSHPGGPARPSAADRAGASEQDFIWLIAGADGLRAFVCQGTELLGADWVTSSL